MAFGESTRAGCSTRWSRSPVGDVGPQPVQNLAPSMIELRPRPDCRVGAEREAKLSSARLAGDSEHDPADG